jgi:hypothetical protein
LEYHRSNRSLKRMVKNLIYICSMCEYDQILKKLIPIIVVV